MAAGTNNIGPRVVAGNGLTNTNPENPTTTTSSFQEVLSKAIDPKNSFLGLGKVLQNRNLSMGERQVACERVISEVLGPNNPYQPLAKDQSFMSAVSTLLAEDPRLGDMIIKYQSRRSR